jgi:hypothetical protein
VCNIPKQLLWNIKYDLFSSIVKASDVYARIGTEAWKRAKSIEMK